MLRPSFFVLLLFLVSIACFGQGSVDTSHEITTDQYRQDFALLRKTLEQTYPSLYRFRDKPSVEKMLDSCYSTISQQTNTTSFYAIIKYVISAFGDGHLSSSASPALRNVFEANLYFPLYLVFLHQGVYNFCNHPLIPKGAQLTSIDGVSLQTIRKMLYPYLVADGAINTSKDWMLNSAFWFYYYLIYGSKQTFVVNYKLPDGSIKTASLKAEQRKNFICSGYEFPQNTDLLNLTYPQKNVAIMTIKTFNHQILTETKKDFRTFLDSSFSAIKQKEIKHLIIDLRGNGGGADVYGAYLYSYLSNKPFRYYKELETKEKKLTGADHPNLELQKPADIHYDGELFFLVNGLTFSAAAEFCAIAKSNQRGKFIGEETGGAYCGNTSGSFVNTVLPNTGITVSIPTTKYVMAVNEIKEKDRGIIPDYITVPTINDILQNKDVEMMRVIYLVGAQKN